MYLFSPSLEQTIQEDDTLILAVSGGVDSMVLFDMIRRCHPRERLIVAHFDHSLRGDESDGDRIFIANICKDENIPFEMEKMDIEKLAEEEKMSIENAARKYRYAFLFGVAEKYDATYILTAHHTDDRIETAMFNLIRGSKLGGIHALETISDAGLVKIYRPLIDREKSEILKYAKENDIMYREDSSNTDTLYLRNHLRKNILPEFERINPEYRHAITNFIEYTEELKNWIDDEIYLFLSDSGSFTVGAFQKKSSLFQKEIIRYLYEKANAGTIGLSEGNIEEILRFISDSVTPHAVKEIKKLRLERRNEKITFKNAQEK